MYLTLKILIIESDFVSRHYMRDLLTFSGYDCLTAMNASEGLDIYASDSPDVIICNVILPGMSGLEFLSTIRSKGDNRTFVVMIATCSSERLIVQSFRTGANDFLKKPVQDKELIPIIEKYQQLLPEKTAETIKFGDVEEGRFKLTFRTEFDAPHLIVSQLMSHLDMDFFNEDDRVGVELGLSELITNAIEHGNLNISFEEKSESMADGNGLVELYRQRLSDEKFASRRVTVYFEYDSEECRWTIIDEGDGFDRSHVPDPTIEENLVQLHGRGILFSKVVFDSLEYFGKGNEVVAIKKRKFLI